MQSCSGWKVPHILFAELPAKKNIVSDSCTHSGYLSICCEAASDDPVFLSTDVLLHFAFLSPAADLPAFRLQSVPSASRSLPFSLTAGGHVLSLLCLSPATLRSTVSPHGILPVK